MYSPREATWAIIFLHYDGYYDDLSTKIMKNCFETGENNMVRSFIQIVYAGYMSDILEYKFGYKFYELAAERLEMCTT